jgi:hypothetical protein
MTAASTKARVIDDRPSAHAGSLNPNTPAETEPGAGGHPAPLASAPAPLNRPGADAVICEGR